MLSFTRRAIKDHRRLLENAASLMALLWLNYLIPLATLPYLVRVLGLGSYGKVASAQAFVCYFLIFINYGFDYSATRHIAQNREDTCKVSRVFSAVLTIKFLLMLTSLALATVLILRVHYLRADAILYFSCLPATVAAALAPGWLYQGLERLKTLTFFNGAGSLAYMLLLFALVHSPKDVWLAALLPNFAALLVSIACLWNCVRSFGVRFRLPQLRELTEHLKEGFHLFLTTASITLYTSTNVFLVGLLGGDVQAGLFSAADKMVRAIVSLNGPISQAAYPHVNTLAVESPARSLRFARRLLLLVGPAMLAISLTVFFLAHPLVTLLFGAKSLAVAYVLRWLCITPVIVVVSNTLLVQALMPLRLDNQISRINLSAAVLNLVLCVVLAQRWGAAGAAVSVVATEILVTVWACVTAARFGFFSNSSAETSKIDGFTEESES